MPAGDTAQDRRATLSDGSVLVYRRPGGILLSEIEEAGVTDLLEQIAKQEDALSDAARARMDRQADKGAARRQALLEAEDERIEAMDEAARRKAKRNRRFRNIDKWRLVYHCASTWTDAEGQPVVTLTAGSTPSEGAVTALKDLPEDDVEEAARVIFDSHYARRKQARKNSSTTSAP